MLALLVHVQILSLFHPQRALVDGVPAVAGQRYGGARFVIEVPGLAKPRTYSGSLRVEAAPGELRLINEVDLEDYVASVVAAEAADAPPAARDALAIVARSFALKGRDSGHLCDTTHCQWYRGLAQADIAAARRTLGQVLIDRAGKPAPAWHSQDCGGAVKPDWGASISERTPDTHLPGLARGSGHGVGLCQRGAAFLASKGLSAHQILARYFGHLHIGRL